MEEPLVGDLRGFTLPPKLKAFYICEGKVLLELLPVMCFILNLSNIQNAKKLFSNYCKIEN
jgi:hypothetical protein